jgi:hypothetical protein
MASTSRHKRRREFENDDESSESETDSTEESESSKKKKAKYKTHYSKEWVKKFNFVSACPKNVHDYQFKFHCTCCNVNLLCSTGG